MNYYIKVENFEDFTHYFLENIQGEHQTVQVSGGSRRLKLGKYYSADAKGRTFQGKTQVIVRYLKNGCENEVVTPVADGYAGVNLFSVQ